MGWRAQEAAKKAAKEEAAARTALLEERRREYNSAEAQQARNKRARDDCLDAEAERGHDAPSSYQREMNDAAERRRELELWEDFPDAPPYSPPVAYEPTTPSYSPTTPSYSPTSPAYVAREAPNGAAATLYAPEWVHRQLHGPDRVPPDLPPVDQSRRGVDPPNPWTSFFATMPVLPEHFPTLADGNDEPFDYYSDARLEREQELRAFNNDLVSQARVRREAARSARAAEAAQAAQAAEAAQVRAASFDLFREPAVDESDSEDEFVSALARIGAGLTPAAGEAEEKDHGPMGECLICQDATRTHLCAPCGHLVMCKGCTDRFNEFKVDDYNHTKFCPYCRTECHLVVELRMP